MRTVQAASQRLADQTADLLGGFWELHRTGRIDRPRLISGSAVAVAQANTAAVQLADVGLAAEVARQRRQPTTPLGLEPTPVQIDQARIGADVARIIDTGVDTDGQIRRLGRSEPLLTIAATVQTGMREWGASGWTRSVDRDPCPLCRSWADGIVRHPNTRMARHQGCACIQQPVFTT